MFSSKQLPKKLEFFGDDFRSHFWIVKARSGPRPSMTDAELVMPAEQTQGDESLTCKNLQ